jgi:hypothetical protein
MGTILKSNEDGVPMNTKNIPALDFGVAAQPTILFLN